MRASASGAIPPPLLERFARAGSGQLRPLLRQVPADRVGPWAVQIADAVPARARQQPVHGRRLARAALQLAEASGDPLVRARALRAEGHAHALASDYRLALARYTRAAALFDRAGDRLQLAVTDSGTLQTLIYLGAYDRAHAIARRARRTFTRAGDALRLARLDSNVGNIYFRQDRFERALACYERAEGVMRALGQQQDAAIALRNMAVCLTSLCRFDEAERRYREARQRCADHGLTVLVAESDYNLAYVSFLCCDYERAIQAYAAAEEAAEALGDRYHRALCDLDRAEVCLALNDHAAARRLAEDAARGFRRLGMRYERAKALTFLATARLRLGDGAAALAGYRRARALFVSDGNRAWVASVDLARAVAALHLERDRDAARLARQARRQALAPTARVQWALLQARLALRARRPRAARGLVTGALRQLRTLEIPSLVWQANYLAGEAAEACGDPGGARRCYERARHDLEQLRTQLTSDQVKVTFLADKLGVYERLVTLLLAEPSSAARDTYVLQLIEDAKSRSLADLLAFRASDLPARRDGAAHAHAVRTLRHEVQACARQMADESMKPRPDAPRVRRLHAAAAGRLRRLSTAMEALQTADADLAALQTGKGDRIEAIQAALPPSTVLLEYYVASGTVYAAAVHADRTTVVPVGRLSDVTGLVQLLRFQLAKFQLGPDYVRTFASGLSAATHQHLRTLHAALLAPVRHALDGRALVVVPHGPLHYVPFHALFDGQRYLMQDVAVSYAPSGTVYRLCQSRRESAAGGSLVMALADGYAPHIRQEAEQVAALLPGARLYLGEEATVARLRDEGGASRYVHIATHGFFRRDNPMLSAVRLAGGDLSLADLYTLSLPADLVTLSGCGTGLSAVVGGDELVGLTRGLLHAGARSLLLTMWQVDDFSTATFMADFYGHLLAGRTKAEAVALAMDTLRARFPHPYYWAPFVLIGQSGAASTPGKGAADSSGAPIFPGRPPALLDERGTRSARDTARGTRGTS